MYNAAQHLFLQSLDNFIRDGSTVLAWVQWGCKFISMNHIFYRIAIKHSVLIKFEIAIYLKSVIMLCVFELNAFRSWMHSTLAKIKFQSSMISNNEHLLFSIYAHHKISGYFIIFRNGIFCKIHELQNQKLYFLFQNMYRSSKKYVLLKKIGNHIEKSRFAFFNTKSFLGTL